ncbi:hypothetical protein ACWGB8_35305 [Kitasatospora sp. NPDC054939]
MFAEAFAEPPYGEAGPADADRAIERFRSQTKKAGFLATVAFGSDGQVVGMAYGHPLADYPVLLLRETRLLTVRRRRQVA